MNTTNDLMIELETRAAIEDGTDAIQNAIDTLERALREMQGYAGRYADSETPKDKAQTLNRAIGHLTGILPNLRIDLLANAQARLSKLS